LLLPFDQTTLYFHFMREKELLTLIRGRRSVQRFEKTAIADEHIEQILEAGRWAPSYLNSQPWEFFVLRDPDVRARTADVLRRVTISWEGFAQAPVILIVAVDVTTDPRHHVEDGAAAAQNMSLMTHALGLSAFWVSLYGENDTRGTPEDELRTLLGAPRKLRLVAALPIGVAAYAPESARRSLLEIVHRDGYKNGRRHLVGDRK
jgi:nitroreductase